MPPTRDTTSYKHPIRRLTVDHLKFLKAIIQYKQLYTTNYKAIFDEPHRESWSEEVECKYRHIHTTLDHILGRGTHTETCDPQQKTLLLVSDIETYLAEVIDFAEYRTTPQGSRDYIPVSQIPSDWHAHHDKLIRMEHWVKGVLLAISPTDIHADVTQGLTHAIHLSMMMS